MIAEPECNFAVDIAASKTYLRLVSILHVLALLACWLAAVIFLLKLILSVMVCVSWHRAYGLSKMRLISLRYHAKSGWTIFNHRTATAETIVWLPTSVVSCWVTVLHYNMADSFQTLLICHDTMPKNAYRRLRVLLNTTRVLSS